MNATFNLGNSATAEGFLLLGYLRAYSKIGNQAPAGMSQDTQLLLVENTKTALCLRLGQRWLRGANKCPSI